MKALSIRGLGKIYKNGVEAVQGVDLDVDQGDFFALLGPNGAGKSTVIGIICSLVNKTAGRVSVFGHDLDSEVDAVKSSIGLVPQEFNFSQFEPIIEIVLNQAGFYGIPRDLAYQRAEQYLRQLDLWERRFSQARELSGGMKRRLMIARALVHRPRLLVLDEPTAGVDIEIRRTMWDFLREINEQGTTIILTTHYLEEAESLCRNLAIINCGQIVEHASMSKMLLRLHRETFILSVEQEVQQVPVYEEYQISKLDDHTLEVSVQKEQGLNLLFELLDADGIKVISLRNKQNRLEQLFLDLVQNGGCRPVEVCE